MRDKLRYSSGINYPILNLEGRTNSISSKKGTGPISKDLTIKKGALKCNFMGVKFSSATGKEHKFAVFGNRKLKKIFKRKRVKITGGKELHGLYLH